MAFQVRCTFNRIESYKDALRAWTKGVVFRKEPAVRGLVDSRKKHLTVGQTEDGSIVLRLYGHDTVTWHPDNSVTIRSYSSRSTAVFASHCTPYGMYVTSGDQFRVTVDGRTYKVAGWITFRQRDNTWKPDEITPWKVPFVNRKRSAEALRETGYNTFRLWLTTYVQMAPQPGRESYKWLNNTAIVSMLRDRSKWRELVATRPSAWNQPEAVLSEIRKAVHDEYGCTEYKSVPFLSRGN